MTCELCQGECFIGDHYPCPACTAPSMHPCENYRDEVDQFFRDELPQSHHGDKGKVWIVDHGPFQTLTVEPLAGGQYEIAVRLSLLGGDHQAGDKFSGYVARDGYMIGRNTHGH